MEQIPQATLTLFEKSRWLHLYRWCQRGPLNIVELTSGNNWCNPSVNLVHERVRRSRPIRTWNTFSVETAFTYLELQRDAYMANMNLGLDSGSLVSFLNWDRPQ